MKNRAKHYLKTVVRGIKGEAKYHYKKHKIKSEIENKKSNYKKIQIEKEKIEEYRKEAEEMSVLLENFTNNYNDYKKNYNSFDDFFVSMEKKVNEVSEIECVKKYGDLSDEKQIYRYLYKNNEKFKSEIDAVDSKGFPEVFSRYKSELLKESKKYKRDCILNLKNELEKSFVLEDRSKSVTNDMKILISDIEEKENNSIKIHNEIVREYNSNVKKVKEFKNEREKHVARMSKLGKKAKEIKKKPFDVFKKMKCLTQSSYYRDLASKGKKSLCSLGIIGKYFDFDAKHEYKGYSIENPKLFKNALSNDKDFKLHYNFMPNKKNKSLFGKEKSNVEVHLPLEVCSDGTYRYNMNQISFEAKELGNIRKKEVKNMRRFIEDNAFRMSMDEVKDFTKGNELAHTITRSKEGYPCQVWTCNGKVVFEAREVRISRPDGSYETRYTCYKGMNISEDSGKELPIQVNIGDLTKSELNKHFRMFDLYAKEIAKDVKLDDEIDLDKNKNRNKNKDEAEFENKSRDKSETHKNKEGVEAEL